MGGCLVLPVFTIDGHRVSTRAVIQSWRPMDGQEDESGGRFKLVWNGNSAREETPPNK